MPDALIVLLCAVILLGLVVLAWRFTEIVEWLAGFLPELETDDDIRRSLEEWRKRHDR